MLHAAIGAWVVSALATNFALSAPLPGIVDFAVQGAASNPAESQATLAARSQAITWSMALLPLFPNPAEDPARGFEPVHAEAKLSVGFEIDEVNRAILDPRVKPYAKVGTDFSDLGALCRRTGDYDFKMIRWLPILYRFWDRPDLLWPETREKILHELITEKGGKIESTRWFCFVPVRETENHMLMTEVSQYLANTLVNRERVENGFDPLPAYNNETNGMNRWMLSHLQQFLKNDFEEYNSRPYQPYAIVAIQTLFDHAADDRVRTMAQNVLDYLAIKFALQSNELRRLPPFRRQQTYLTNWDMLTSHGESDRMLGLTGLARHVRGAGPAAPGKPLFWDAGVGHAHRAALSPYRLPPLILDLLFRRDRHLAFERIHHRGIEIYSREPSFLISAGGLHTFRVSKTFKNPSDGFGMPTILMPTDGGLFAQELIRIEGHRNPVDLSNTCVAPGFACGLQPVIPDAIPAQCRVQEGPWTFVDFTAPRCPLGYRLFAAVYSAPCDNAACRKAADRFGFFEAVSSDGLSFEAYKAGVLSRNGGKAYGSQAIGTFVTWRGDTIEFQPFPSSPWTWPIVSMAGYPQERDMTKWPLARGTLMTADGQGRVEIRNPWLGKTLRLDGSDAMHPTREETP